ncbi:MAG TPA: VTT domain-containing protein, partial [Gemmatimonadales bacterium]|nr:VTT domain-containing protein [Gemmatimonadales bacterium]
VDLDAMAVRQWLVDLRPIAPLAYVAIYALQVMLAPLPGLPIGAAAGFVFGLVPAIIFGSAGLGIGVVVALLAGRLWGLRLLARVAGPDAIAKWEQLRLVNSPVTWLVIFLGPSPDLIIFVAGMTRIPLPRLFLIALLGRAPAMIAATLLGAGRCHCRRNQGQGLPRPRDSECPPRLHGNRRRPPPLGGVQRTASSLPFLARRPTAPPGRPSSPSVPTAWAGSRRCSGLQNATDLGAGR